MELSIDLSSAAAVVGGERVLGSSEMECGSVDTLPHATSAMFLRRDIVLDGEFRERAGCDPVAASSYNWRASDDYGRPVAACWCIQAYLQLVWLR